MRKRECGEGWTGIKCEKCVTLGLKRMHGTATAERIIVEATRIIPNSKDESRAKGVDRGLIKFSKNGGQEVLTGVDAETNQRFAGEVKYVNYFAQRLAEVLNMHTLEMGVIDDREGQTAFHATAGGGWHGVMGKDRRSFKQAKEALSLT